MPIGLDFTDSKFCEAGTTLIKEIRSATSEKGNLVLIVTVLSSFLVTDSKKSSMGL